jgi:ADP-heptose:LPS heptosyltransferase
MILVLRALGIGDLCVAVPALRGLRAAHPDEELLLAAPGWLAPLAALTGAIDRLVPTDGLAPIQWGGAGSGSRGRAAPRPRLAVNLHGRGPESHRLLAATRPGRLLAFACPAAAHHEGPEWIEDEHEVCRWCRLLGWYGVASDPADLALAAPGPTPYPDATIVHPGAKAAHRRWPAARFVQVAARLREAGHRVVVTGSAGDQRLATAVAQASGLPATSVLAGRTDTGALAALVARARLGGSADTGVGHLATAYGTPSVVLFGAEPPQRWGPPVDRPRHRALWHGPRAGLTAISTAEVLEAADAAAAQ